MFKKQVLLDGRVGRKERMLAQSMMNMGDAWGTYAKIKRLKNRSDLTFTELEKSKSRVGGRSFTEVTLR